MPSPILPNAIKEVIPGGTGSFCSRFLKVLTLPRLVWEMVRYLFKEDGTPSDDFCADLAIACECTTGGFEIPCITPPPPSVTASDGTYADKVRVTWTAVADATRYDVYRSTTNASGTATFLGSSVTSPFDDSTGDVGTVYYYWVRAVGPTCTSAFSASDSGFSTAGGLVSGNMLWGNPGSYTWVVPVGVTSIAVEVVGGGGKEDPEEDAVVHGPV